MERSKTFSRRDIPESLRELMSLDMQIDTKAQELSRWREISQKAAGPSYTRAGGPGSRTGSMIEDCVIKIEAIERAIASDVDKLVALRHSISMVIDSTGDPLCISLLSLRYLNGMSWERVAECMNYSYSHIVHRLHPRALAKFSTAYSEAESKGGVKNSG